MTDIVERLRRRAANAEDTVLGQYKEIERLRLERETMRKNRMDEVEGLRAKVDRLMVKK